MIARSVVRAPLLPALLLFAAGGLPAQQTQPTYQTPPAALARLVDAPPIPGVSVSPDDRTLLLLEQAALPTIAELARPELRLAGLRIDPSLNGPSRSRGYQGLVVKAIEGGAERRITGLPADARIRNVSWSPDGSRIAFTLDREDRVELWTAATADGMARRLTERAVNDASRGGAFEWLHDGSGLLVRLVPDGRGAAPTRGRVPGGPVIQETSGDAAAVRTYQDLLQDAHDEALFEYYTTSELARVGLDGTITRLTRPLILVGQELSPDGRYILTEVVHRPYSYLVTMGDFPTRIEVLSATDGAPVKLVADLPLQEQVPPGFGSVPTGPRSVGWRADAPATLYWAEAQDGGDARMEAAVRDRVYLLEAPFTGAPVTLADLPLRYAGIQWGTDDLALLNESWWATRTRRVYAVRPGRPEAEKRIVWDYQYENRYADPGFPVTRRSRFGTPVLETGPDGDHLYLMGAGASPQGNRPFLRRMDIATGETEELFRSQAPWYEAPEAILDIEELELLTTRESPTDPPNYFVRDLDDDRLTAVTDFEHPYPELRDVKKEMLVYEREDGVQLTATLYTPAGYDQARDGPLPAFVWAYPREFKSADAAGQVTDSPYRFNRVSASGAIPFVTRGYAVLDNAAMPIVGEGEEEPNDSYVDQLVASARAAIQEGVRRGVVDPARVGVGGHSYGAFMTANLLAHSNLFAAGIARSGAYNRTLTPFGFQSEERLFWEAPEVYYRMSPFMNVQGIDEPILLIHGQADNNSGTFPIQSERFYAALKGLGKTARYVELPHESHGYAARESILHMLWEMDRWLETHVKNAARRTVSDGGALRD